MEISKVGSCAARAKIRDSQQISDAKRECAVSPGLLSLADVCEVISQL